MHGAMMDCFDADRMRGIPKHGYAFLNRLQFTSPEQIRSVNFFALHPKIVGWENAETIKAWDEKDQGKAVEKQYLHMVREMLREGMTERQALESLDDNGVFRQMAMDGRTSFFITLGDILRKPIQESKEGRILKAWIPLNLGACKPDGIEAHDLFEDYNRALKRRPLDYKQFKPAWNNVRNKHLAQLCGFIRKAGTEGS